MRYRAPDVGGSSAWSNQDLTFVVPAYRSASWIEWTLIVIAEVAPGAGIVVVDDASDDGTAGRALVLRERGHDVRVVCQPVRQGQLAATLRGCGSVDSGFTFTMDDDLLLTSDLLDAAWSALGSGAEVVYFHGTDAAGWRHAASRLARVFARYLGLPEVVRSATSTRVFQSGLIQDLDERPVDIQLAERGTLVTHVEVEMRQVPFSRTRYSVLELIRVAGSYVRASRPT